MEQLLSARHCGKSSTCIIPNPCNNPGRLLYYCLPILKKNLKYQKLNNPSLQHSKQLIYPELPGSKPHFHSPLCSQGHLSNIKIFLYVALKIKVRSLAQVIRTSPSVSAPSAPVTLNFRDLKNVIIPSYLWAFAYTLPPAFNTLPLFT